MAGLSQTSTGRTVSTEDGFKLWYQAGQDVGTYDKAFEACKRVNASIKQLDLSPGQRTLIAETRGLTYVKERIRSIEQEILAKTEKGKYTKRLTDLANALCEFATRISGVVEILIPQSPEYIIPFNSIVLIFQTVVAKNEKQAALSDFFLKLAQSLPLADFYRTVFPTDEMRQTVVSIYIEAVDLIERATKYYCLGFLRKLSDAIVQPIEYRFETYIKNIESSKQRMFELKDAAHAAQQTDMKYTLDSTNKALIEFRRELNTTINQISSSIAQLQRKVEAAKQSTEKMRYAEAVLNASRLIEVFLPDAPLSSEELIVARERHSDISQRDHWENNGILEPLSLWSIQSSTSHTSVLWIGGTSGNQDSWITEFSVDIVQALGAQDLDMALAYVFFDSLPGKRLTATEFVKLAISRIIEQRPELIMELPELLNKRSLRRSSTFLSYWRIFEQMMSRLDAIFLILDRIDASAQDTAGHSAVELILPRILKLVSKMAGKLRIIITSTQRPPSTYERHPTLSSIWIDTGIRAMKREDR